MVNMNKKMLFPALLGFILLTLIACGGNDTAEATSEPAAVPPTAVPAAPITAPIPTQAPTQVPALAPTDTPPAEPTRVATDGELFLQLVQPTETEVFTDSDTLLVSGRTRVDAVVTINDTIVEPNIDGEFSLDVPLEEGPNIIEVVVSVASGEQMDLVLVAIYLP